MDLAVCNLSHFKMVKLNVLLHIQIGLNIKIQMSVKYFRGWSPVHYWDYSVEWNLNGWIWGIFCTRNESNNYCLSFSNKLGWAELSLLLFCFWKFFFLSTEILAMGGWLNSFLLFNNSCFFRFEILTASLAWRVNGSLNLLVISILNLISSPLWSLLLCLNMALSPLPLLNWLICSDPLVLAERDVSPS